MSPDLRAVVVKYTALLLDVSEGEVTSDTVIPDIRELVICVCDETRRMCITSDVHGKYTVAQAIELFKG